MKIVIDARTLRDGSTGRYVERLLHYLQRLDRDNDYTVLLKPADYAGWEPTNKRFGKRVCAIKEYSFAEQLAFKKQLEDLKPDLVHFIMTHQPVLYRGPVVTTIHDLTTARFRNPSKNAVVFGFKQQVYKWVIKGVARKSKHVLVPTRYVKDDLVNYSGIDPAKVTVTYEAADKIAGRPRPVSQLEGKEFLMYVGRSTPHKNLRRLVESFAELKTKHPGLWLVLVGKVDTNKRQLKRYAESIGLSQVSFQEYLPDASLRWLYENAKAYVFPSLSEGFGLPGLEALLYGLPLASSNATCLPEVYGDAAVYFNPRSVTDMTAQIDRILSDPELAGRLSARGPKQAAKYSWQTTASQTLEIYNKILSSNS